jgi:diguanylate cyclase (GGDEF)-like protein
VGLEDAWRNTTIPEARYPGLGSGKYRFEVRTVNSVGEFGPIRALELTVLTPWWKTPWFYGLLILGLVGLVLLVIRWRTTMLLRRTVELESQVQERTWELEIANKALEEASMVDPLTGLRNRRYLGLSMPEEIARTQRAFRDLPQGVKKDDPLQEDLVFLLMDLDHFKQVNDTHGHAAGDQVLRETATILKSCCRESDTLVRWGGEEFLLVAKRTNRAFADLIARNLCEAVADHAFKLADGTILRKTISIGFIVFPIIEAAPGLLGWEEGLEIADQCLYAVKHSGRNGFIGITRINSTDTEASLHSLIHELPAMVSKGQAQIKTSFPEPEAIRWENT